MGGDSRECISPGASCGFRYCDCNEKKPMESLEDIKKYEKAEILTILQRGTIKKAKLQNDLSPYVSERRIRGFIAELIQDGQCIQSSNEGYTLIQTREQLLTAMEYLNSKAKAIAIRKNTLFHNYNKNRTTGEQITLDL